MPANRAEFSIVDENPKALYALIRDARDLHGPTRYKARTIKVGELYPEEGLFNRCLLNMQAIDVQGGVRCYTGELMADYREADHEYWAEGERDRLTEMLSIGAKLIDPAAEPAVKTHKAGPREVYHEIFLALPPRNLRFGIGPLYDTESVKWQAQVRVHQEGIEHLRSVLAPEMIEGLTKTFHKIVDNQLLQGHLDINFEGLDDNGERCLLALRPENFFDRIRTWHQFAEMAVRAVSEVKGNPQTGILIVQA